MSLPLARQLVMSHGWNTTSYQILNPGFQYWFAPGGKAVVAYTQRRHTLLVAGAPVCSAESVAGVCAAFEIFAASRGCGVCYVCAQERLLSHLIPSRKHAAVVLGAQPVWDPHGWPGIVKRNASLRAQLNRCRNKGVTVDAMPAAIAASHPGLRSVLREWLTARPMPPMHFLVETDVFDGSVGDRIVFAARRGGAPVAFLVASPVATRDGYLVELIARSHAAPNGTGELLIDAAMHHFAA
jgi:phosphatidylglycerol lysyltransferase